MKSGLEGLGSDTEGGWLSSRADGILACFGKMKGAALGILQKIQFIIDQSHPYTFYRWMTTLFLITIFMARIVVCEGWYVVAYTMWIYLLNAFLAFITPKFDPSLDDIDNKTDMSEYHGAGLPMSNDDEFRPFIRRLPEFLFWYNSFRAVIISIFCTFFDFLNIPVFWPVLLVYFIILFIATMKRQIKHMIKYKYIPLDLGKKTYKFAGEQ